jgi:hypothetical protein
MAYRKIGYTVEANPAGDMARGQIITACRIAVRYASRIPSASELMSDFAMSRATAYRWRSALSQVRGMQLQGAA